MTLRTLSTSLLLALSLAACGQSVAAPVDAPVPAPILNPPDVESAAAACAVLYGSYAAWMKGCTGSQLADAEIAHFVEGCVQRAALPGIDATPTAIASCGAQVAASSCATLPLDCILATYQSWGAPVARDFLVNEQEAGGQLFPRTRGKLPAGQACDIAAQCYSGACSTTFSYDFDHTCGVCVDAKITGEACDATTFCEYGSSCTDGVCKDWGSPLGAACEAPKGDSNCANDLYCPHGTCVPRLHVGDYCGDGSSVDQWEACSSGSKCRALTCKPVVEVPAGDVCDDDLLLCGTGMFCAEGHCRAPVADVGLGGACVIDACAPALRCRGGVCAPPAQAGEHCYEDRECGPGLICPSLLQQDPRCAPPSQEGEACVSSDACDNGLACEFTASMTAVCHPKVAAGEPCDDSHRCWAPLTCIDGTCGEIGVCSSP